MRSVKETILSQITGRKGKSNYWCLVSGGASGIVKKDLPEYIQDAYERSIDIHFEYLRIDFGNGHQLAQNDYGLDPSVIVGLQIAHAFFIEKEYEMKFREFRAALSPNQFNNFDVQSVISECRKSLNLPDNHLFSLYLHIDEFQLIDSWDKNDKLEQISSVI
ncbi:hypothetical protein RclHR1_07280015 [Rhizophagus clarus]|uniref:Uncharacterized protein n=1 Tax=Rhizophagus clarus TaxID=94130 RepID=A0A2Z6RVI8_9GLOM|nr:hypothetical protein RclHR1_07280015 [Rhizophagus clarus]GES94967.1 hypothetical protein GLOIN_2v1775729 [Rhizophagus clarus]